MHSFATSRVDYCNTIYAGRSPISCNECSTLHVWPSWPVTRDVQSWPIDTCARLTPLARCATEMIYRCLYGLVPRYLVDHLTPASEGATEIARTDIARPSKLWGLTSRDWTTRDQVARVDIARPDNVAPDQNLTEVYNFYGAWNTGLPRFPKQNA